jgi:hypothetical protein
MTSQSHPTQTVRGADLVRHYAEVRARLMGVELRPEPKVITITVQPKPLEPIPVVQDDVCPLNMLTAPSWRFLVALAAIRGEVHPRDIIGPSRVRNICAARHEAMHLIVAHTAHSYVRIGRLMGGRDHTTVINSLSKFAPVQRPRPAFLSVVEPPQREVVHGIPEGSSLRQAIEVGYSKGVSVSEIARAAGTTRGTIKVLASLRKLAHPNRRTKSKTGWEAAGI